jgi:hypothetical protein
MAFYYSLLDAVPQRVFDSCDTNHNQSLLYFLIRRKLLWLFGFTSEHSLSEGKEQRPEAPVGVLLYNTVDLGTELLVDANTINEPLHGLNTVLVYVVCALL